MGFSSKPKVPAPVIPAIPTVAQPPTLASTSPVLASAANNAINAKKTTGLGMDNTIKTSGQGVQGVDNLAQPTLIGKS